MHTHTHIHSQTHTYRLSFRVNNSAAIIATAALIIFIYVFSNTEKERERERDERGLDPIIMFSLRDIQLDSIVPGLLVPCFLVQVLGEYVFLFLMHMAIKGSHQ